MKKWIVILAAACLLLGITAAFADEELSAADAHVCLYDENVAWIYEPTCQMVGELIRRCSICQDERPFTVNITPHDWLKATCIEPQRCKFGCGAIRGLPLGCDHSVTVDEDHVCQWSPWHRKIVPTCQKGGTVTRHCYLCHQDQVVHIADGIADHLTVMADCGKHQVCQYGCGHTIGDAVEDSGFYVYELPGYPVPVCGLCSKEADEK